MKRKFVIHTHLRHGWHLIIGLVRGVSVVRIRIKWIAIVSEWILITITTIAIVSEWILITITIAIITITISVGVIIHSIIAIIIAIVISIVTTAIMIISVSCVATVCWLRKSV